MIHPILREAFRDSDHKHDPWGSAIGLHFAVADVLYVTGEPIPGEWEYRAAMGLEEIDPEDWPATWFKDEYDADTITGDDLRHFGDVLSRYTRIMDSMGRSY